VRTEAYTFLSVETAAGICTARLTHPDPDHGEREEWPRLIAEVAADDEVRVLVLTGWSSPRRGPVAGDFDDFDAFAYYDRARQAPVMALLNLDKPVVAALDGDPGVLTIPLSCDIIIAERHLSFADNHVLIGTASATQPFLWPMSTGLTKAKRYILTGERFSAGEGEAMGLFTEVVDRGASLTRAMDYAARLAQLRPESLQATKRTLNQWMRLAQTAVFEQGLALEFMLFPKDFSARYREGRIVPRP
jgi:enoyl-CoA hydratase/carnithine racemase